MMVKGWKRAGCWMIRHSAGTVEDDAPGRLQEMLKDANLPLNWHDISSSESTLIPAAPMPPPPPELEIENYDDWVTSLRGWQSYYDPAVPPPDVTQVRWNHILYCLTFLSLCKN